jgi:hypothetical protein
MENQRWPLGLSTLSDTTHLNAALVGKLCKKYAVRVIERHAINSCISGIAALPPTEDADRKLAH